MRAPRGVRGTLYQSHQFTSRKRFACAFSRLSPFRLCLALSENGFSSVGHLDPLRQIDPETGAILRTIESNRFVTGVTWIDGELWHGTWEGDQSDLRRVDPRTGEVLERVEMPPGVV